MKPVSVYDWKTRKRLAYLQNAHDISYTKKLNSIWTAEFALPHSDPKTVYCKPFNLVELWDINSEGKNVYVGLFRIQPTRDELSRIDGTIIYTLEHVITTLLDDTLVDWHDVGGAEVFTSTVIGNILNAQTEQNWEMGACDYNYEFLYGWQDENLLSALLSIAKPFEDNDYYWSYDTSSYPWHVSLLRANPDPITDIRYRKNLSGMQRTEDPSNIITRLYCKGYGEGENTLNIKSVNPSGEPYIDSPNVNKYGIITYVLRDESLTNSDMLLAAGKSLLSKIDKPVVSYKMEILTINKVADLSLGDSVRIVSEGLDETMILKSIYKPNVSKFPKQGTVKFSVGTVNSLEDGISDLAQRQRISETYSQGAASIFIDSFADNADEDDPVEVTFLVPPDAVHVNQILFSASLKPFRAYSKSAKSGGGVANAESGGGGDFESLSDAVEADGELTDHPVELGGEVDERTDANYSPPNDQEWSLNWTSISNLTSGHVYPENYENQPTQKNDDFHGVVEEHYIQTSDLSDAYLFDTVWLGNEETFVDVLNIGESPVLEGPYPYVSNHKHPFKKHGHRIRHAHNLSDTDHSHEYNLIVHNHTIQQDDHGHKLKLYAHDHKLNVDAHTHKITLPSHTHRIDLDPHTHPIEYGLFKGPTADTMTIHVDGVLIDEVYTGYVDNLDLIEYMPKTEGKVSRGEHTITITPNSLSRIQGYFQVRLFTNSRGGNQF